MRFPKPANADYDGVTLVQIVACPLKHVTYGSLGYMHYLRAWPAYLDLLMSFATLSDVHRIARLDFELCCSITPTMADIIALLSLPINPLPLAFQYTKLDNIMKITVMPDSFSFPPLMYEA